MQACTRCTFWLFLLVLIKHPKILLLCLWSFTTFHEHEMIRRIVIGTVDLKQDLAVRFLMLVCLTSCCIQNLQHILSSGHDCICSGRSVFACLTALIQLHCLELHPIHFCYLYSAVSIASVCTLALHIRARHGVCSVRYIFVQATCIAGYQYWFWSADKCACIILGRFVVHALHVTHRYFVCLLQL